MYSTNGVLHDGITSWMKSHLARMDQTDLELHALAFENTPDDLLEEIRACGLQIHMVPSRTKPLRFAVALNKTLRAGKFDAIHINGNSSTVAIDLLATIGAGVRARIVHSHNTTGAHPIYHAILRPVATILTTDRLACGREAGRWMFGTQPYAVLPNGNDLSAYAFDPEIRERMRPRLSASPDDIVIGHVGTFNAQKNHDHMVKVFARAHAQNPRLRLALIGAGHLQEPIEQLAVELGISSRITFVGLSSEVPEFLSSFDAAVLPSLHEGLPLVVIEWQANGLNSYVSDDVTDECAITDLVSFLPLDDVDGWVHALTQVTAVDRTSASQHAREKLRSAGYDVDDGAARLRRIYLQIGDRIGLTSPVRNDHDRSER
ncbi:MAG: glycosyltransferase [Actinobacteria bacterium]|nr:glycosyltransferase [Actinomycetota bacterium]